MIPGDSCTQCLSMPGCVHGHCIKPFECRCQEGWSGMFCDKRKFCPFFVQHFLFIYKSNFFVMNIDSFDGILSFLDTLQIIRCIILLATCKLGCHPQNGYCEQPGECRWVRNIRENFEARINKRWYLMYHDERRAINHRVSNCSSIYSTPGFRCRFGFKGENCSDCATMPGCQRGSCDQPLDCNCHQGWKGLFCSIRELKLKSL